jgi:hypothetical protein
MTSPSWSHWSSRTRETGCRRMSTRETDNQSWKSPPCRAPEDQRLGQPSPTYTYTNTTEENPIQIKEHKPSGCILCHREALICYLGDKTKAVRPLLAVAVRRPRKWKEEAPMVRYRRRRGAEMGGGREGAGRQHFCGVAVAMVARGRWRRKGDEWVMWVLLRR